VPGTLARVLDRLRWAREGDGRRRSAGRVPAALPTGQLVPAVPRDGGAIDLSVDGVLVEAFAGESVLAAVLRHRRALRRCEFDGAPRAGFCLMGACQDCWVWVGDDRRVRACTTLATDGMAVRTGLSGEGPPIG
jgi:2Fe-2S iron-sulfur cluster binding domain